MELKIRSSGWVGIDAVKCEGHWFKIGQGPAVLAVGVG